MQDGNGFVSTSEIRFVMDKLGVFFSDGVSIILAGGIFL